MEEVQPEDRLDSCFQIVHALNSVAAINEASSGLSQCRRDLACPGCDNIPVAIITKRLFYHILHGKFFQAVDFIQIDVAVKNSDVPRLDAVGDWFQVSGNQSALHQL